MQTTCNVDQLEAVLAHTPAVEPRPGTIEKLREVMQQESDAGIAQR